MLKAHIIKHRRGMEVDVRIDLAQGGCLGLFGTSGAGKSTVLACIAGVEEPDGGYVEWAGKQFFPGSVPLHSRGVGYLTQDPALFPHLRVGQNVTFGIPRRQAHEPHHAEWIATLRDRLGLQPLWHAHISSISGGQARRVSLARMLARKPQLVLLDEPFTGMDRHRMREAIDDLTFWRLTLGFTMIAVDHQAGVLRRLCPDGAMVLEQGRIVQQGRWENLYTNPATPLLGSLLRPL
jgi:iron(III) transport system ATP-binding protein